MLPIHLGHRYFPKNKGLATGIIGSGFGLGSFTFNFIVKAIINP